MENEEQVKIEEMHITNKQFKFIRLENFLKEPSCQQTRIFNGKSVDSEEDCEKTDSIQKFYYLGVLNYNRSNKARGLSQK
jgi:hypothetical protein